MAIKKSKKKPHHAPPKKKAKHLHPRSVTRILKPEQRAKMVKPPADYDGIAKDTLDKWPTYKRFVRVEGLTIAGLKRLYVKTTNAVKWEKDAEHELQKAKDARLESASDLWKALLDLKAAVETAARKSPGLLDVFEALVESMKHQSSGGGGNAGHGGEVPKAGGPTEGGTK